MNEVEKRRGCAALIVVMLTTIVVAIASEYRVESPWFSLLFGGALLGLIVYFAAKNDLGA